MASSQPRSKSQASEAISSSRVGTEARRPVPRRPEAPTVETRDSFTQTDGGDLSLEWDDLPNDDGLTEDLTVDLSDELRSASSTQGGALQPSAVS